MNHTEKDIQTHLYNYLQRLPKWLGLEKLSEKFSLNREDLLFYPLKYIIYKKYNHIFDKMLHSFDGLHKFSKEYNTAEYLKSKPRIDILAYTDDPNTFYIIEVKGNKSPERQTITELLEYANGLQINDFPGLSNDDIVFVIVAKEWSNILIQSVLNGILFRNLNILPLKVDTGKSKKYNYSFFDIWDTNIVHNLDKEIYNEENYITRLLAFEDFQDRIHIEDNDMIFLTMKIASDLSKEGRNGYILGMDTNQDLMYNNCLAILEFDPFILKNKKWVTFTKNKSKEIYDFSMNNIFDINTEVLRNNIIFLRSENQISFEEGRGSTGLIGLSKDGRLFSYGYPFGFLELLIKELIIFCRKDSDFCYLILNTDDVSGNNNMSHWMYLNQLFHIYKSGYKSLKDIENNYFN